MALVEEAHSGITMLVSIPKEVPTVSLLYLQDSKLECMSDQ